MNRPPPPPQSTHLFVYGTLLFDEIVQALTDRTFGTLEVTLHEFARHAIVRQGQREAYPAIRSRASGKVHGRVLLNVDDRSMRLIDRYENDPPEYERVTIRVECDGGNPLQANTYIASPTLRPLLHGDWHVEQFQREHLTKYVREIIPQLRREFGRAQAGTPVRSSQRRISSGVRFT